MYHSICGRPAATSKGVRSPAVISSVFLVAVGPERARPRHRWPGLWAQFWSHSPPYRAVHRRTRAACLPWSRILPAGGGCRCAVLESVRGGNPSVGSNPTSTATGLRKHRSRQPAGGHVALPLVSFDGLSYEPHAVP